VATIIEQEETKRLLIRGSQVRSDEEHGPHALAIKFLRNPNTNDKRAINDKYIHCKKLGHKKDGFWFLHPELRLATWVDQSDGGRKGEKSEKGETSERERGFYQSK
jgi:hypothetical protein